MKIKLISNMYPSNKDKLFGVFVKKTLDSLVSYGANVTQKIVIKGRKHSKLKKILTYFAYFSRALSGILNIKYQIVYIHFLTHNLPIIWWYIIFQRKPIIVNLHGSDINRIEKHSYIDKVQNRVLRKVDQIIVPSHYFQDLVVKRYPNLQTPIFVYPSGGIDIDLYSPLEKNKSNNEILISFVSRIDEGKGWRDFIKIVESLNKKGISCRAIIAGDGRERNALEMELQKSDFKQKFDYRGFQDKKNLAEIYQRSNLFIFPTELPESLGLVGLEAMACKTVVFARNIGGASSYIEQGKNGFLFIDLEDAIRQIELFLKLPKNERENLGKAALKTAKAYDSRLVSKKLFKNLASHVS